MNRLVFGVDIGTTSVKLIVLDQDHQIVFHSSLEHTLFSPQVGYAEEDATVWIAHSHELFRKAMQYLQTYRQPFEICAVGVSGMVPAIVLVGEDGEPVRKTIQQNDARAVQEIEQTRSVLDQHSVFYRTGSYTNQQHVLPRLLWVKQHEPETWSQVQRICGSYDYLVHDLTGMWSIEENFAVESGLYDIHRKAWISEYMELFNIPSEWFPKVYGPSEIVGVVTKEANQNTLLPIGVPVIAGSADHVASALSAGVLDEGDLLIKFGGAGDILFCTNDLVTHDKLFFDVHNIPDKYLLNGCMASSGSLVRWFVNEFVGNSADNEKDVYQRLDLGAEAIGPGSDGLVILPYMLGEKTPILDPLARGVFFGLSLHHTRSHMFRAILESVIYGFRHHIDVLAEKGLKPKRVFATNGGAKSELWLQIAADILRLPLTSYKDHPGSSLGVAFLAGKSIGLFQDWNEVLECIPEQSKYTPNEQVAQVYDVTYGVYRRLYTTLQDDFHLVSHYFRGDNQ